MVVLTMAGDRGFPHLVRGFGSELLLQVASYSLWLHRLWQLLLRQHLIVARAAAGGVRRQAHRCPLAPRRPMELRLQCAPAARS